MKTKRTYQIRDNAYHQSFNEFSPFGPTSEKGFTINEDLFKKIIKKEGVEGWNKRRKNTPNMDRPVAKTREELDIMIEPTWGQIFSFSILHTVF
jgi:hypothetical protein